MVNQLNGMPWYFSQRLSSLSLKLTVEEPVKDGRQQRKHDSIQYNQLDLWLWPRNQAIHANYTVNVGKKRHFLLEMIGETTTFIPHL